MNRPEGSDFIPEIKQESSQLEDLHIRGGLTSSGLPRVTGKDLMGRAETYRIEAQKVLEDFVPEITGQNQNPNPPPAPK